MSGYDDMLNRAMEDMVSDEFETPDMNDPVEMLNQLDAYGADAGSDYNDGEDVMGYFGFRVKGNVLTITLKREGEEDITKTWALVETTDGPPKCECDYDISHCHACGSKVL